MFDAIVFHISLDLVLYRTPIQGPRRKGDLLS